ncbi:hypothetical protein INR49_010278, partial [Caranx melampygus]
TQLHNCFQFPSPACCLVAPRPPPLSARLLPAASSWLLLLLLLLPLGGLGQIRPDQFRVRSSASARTRPKAAEDPAVSWWTFLHGRGVHKSRGLTAECARRFLCSESKARPCAAAEERRCGWQQQLCGDNATLWDTGVIS